MLCKSLLYEISDAMMLIQITQWVEHPKHRGKYAIHTLGGTAACKFSQSFTCSSDYIVPMQSYKTVGL